MDRLRTVWDSWRISVGRLRVVWRPPGASQSTDCELPADRLRTVCRTSVGRLRVVWSQSEGRQWTVWVLSIGRLRAVWRSPRTSQRAGYGPFGTVGDYLQTVHGPLLEPVYGPFNKGPPELSVCRLGGRVDRLVGPGIWLSVRRTVWVAH